MDYNDRELLDYIQEKNEDAMNLLYAKYEPYIQSKAKKLISSCPPMGLDESDLVQEGMIALNEAIQNYNTEYENTFYTFAITCIDHKMRSAIVGATRKKHKILNESVPLYREGFENQEMSLENVIVDNQGNPLNVVLKSEEQESLMTKIKSVLTDFENQVFELKQNEFTYQEIAKILDIDVKSADNAVQRIRAKVSKILKEKKNEEKN